MGCLQDLMGILENNWSEIQNLHLQSLGANTSGKIWISLLIKKIWDVVSYFWNFWNHTLHAIEGPRKLHIIDIINKRFSCHHKKVSIGLPFRCHFLFHTSIHTLLICPIWKRLSWLAVRWCLCPNTSRRILHDTYELLLGRITTGRLSPTLSHIDYGPPLQTTIGPWPPCSLYSEI